MLKSWAEVLDSGREYGMRKNEINKHNKLIASFKFLSCPLAELHSISATVMVIGDLRFGMFLATRVSSQPQPLILSAATRPRIELEKALEYRGARALCKTIPFSTMQSGPKPPGKPKSMSRLN